ncbi:MAG: hypothetical protein WCS34_09780 [Bacteroidales bacterium]
MKHIIDTIFNINNENEILDFVKSYANENANLAEALSKKFLPCEDSDMKDLQGEIDRCFAHPQMDHKNYNTKLNWDLIVDDLYYFIEKIEYMYEKKIINLAVESSLKILEILGEKYIEDEVFEEMEYDDIFFSFYHLTDVIAKLMKCEELNVQNKKRFSERLNEFYDSEPYNNYLPILPHVLAN